MGCKDVNLNSSQEAGIRLAMEIEADMAIEIADEMAEEVLES